MKSFYAQVINPHGAEYYDGTPVELNTRFLLPEQAYEFFGRFGQPLMKVLNEAKPGTSGEFHGLVWIKEGEGEAE